MRTAVVRADKRSGVAFRDLVKSTVRGAALLAALPSLVSFAIRRPLLGADRAFMASTQALALLPGLPGQYIRTAFLRCVLTECAPTVVVEFGTVFSQIGARLGDNVYIGPMCHIGLVRIERDVLVAAGVHIPSGPATHGIDDLSRPIREQSGTRTVVTIGAGAWIGSAAVVLADVGADSVIGAGAVVTRPVPAAVVAAGVPAAVVRTRR
jgi:virginiamycin A acetyltransferase